MTPIRLLRGFFRFWYDFIIGDCWEIAAGVVAILAISVLLVRRSAVPPTSMPFLFAGAIMLLLVLTTIPELLRRLAPK